MRYDTRKRMKTVPDAVNTIEMYAFVISWNSASTGKLLECMTVICAIIK